MKLFGKRTENPLFSMSGCGVFSHCVHCSKSPGRVAAGGETGRGNPTLPAPARAARPKVSEALTPAKKVKSTSPSKAAENCGWHALARGLYLYLRPHGSTRKGRAGAFLVAPPAPRFFGRCGSQRQLQKICLGPLTRSVRAKSRTAVERSRDPSSTGVRVNDADPRLRSGAVLDFARTERMPSPRQFLHRRYER
jgi:hypothetical protein